MWVLRAVLNTGQYECRCRALNLFKYQYRELQVRGGDRRNSDKFRHYIEDVVMGVLQYSEEKSVSTGAVDTEGAAENGAGTGYH